MGKDLQHGASWIILNGNPATRKLIPTYPFISFGRMRWS